MSGQCPNCGCPYVNVTGSSTADVPRAWKDDDGQWYSGPAAHCERSTCQSCGRTTERAFRRGKLVREEVTHHGAPPESEVDAALPEPTGGAS